jgi:hypothetical protein
MEGSGLSEIGYLAFSSQCTPAVELKQTSRDRIVASRMCPNTLITGQKFDIG